MLIYQISAYNMHEEKIKGQSNKFKISRLMQNEKFELSDGSYSVLNIQDYSEYIIKKHEVVIDNTPIRICLNKIENRTTFKIKKNMILSSNFNA